MKKIAYAASLALFGLLASCSKEMGSTTQPVTPSHANIKAMARNYAGETSTHCFDDDLINSKDPCAQKGSGCLDPVTVHPHSPLHDGLVGAVQSGNNGTIRDYFSSNSGDLTTLFNPGRINDVIKGKLTVTLFQTLGMPNVDYFKFTDGVGLDVVPVVSQ